MNHKTRPSWQPLAWDIVAALVVLFAGGLLGWPGMGGPFGPFFGASPGEGFGGFGGFDSGSGPGGPLGPRPHETAALQIASALLLAVPATAMLARRRWPLTVFGVAFVCFAGATLLHVPGFGAGVAVVIAGYALAYRRSRSTAFGVAVAAAVVIVLLSLMRGDWGTFDLRVLQIAPALLISTALGDSARSRREVLAAAEERAARAEETREFEVQRRVSDERLRIARELHDTVAHQISVISLNAGAASGALRDRPERAEEALQEIRSASRGVLSEIGELLRFLREGEASTAVDGIERVAEIVARLRQAGMSVEYRTSGELSSVSPAIGAAAFRIAQEGLTNAQKHGDGKSCALTIDARDGEVVVRVENPLPRTPKGAVSSGLGLVGVRERVAAVGGSVTAGPAGPVTGGAMAALRHDRFVLEARLPIGARGASAAAAAPIAAPSQSTQEETP